jgi:hypothetical protein
MNSAKPFGDPKTARIFIIGHDPRLQKSAAEAEFVFFLEYLSKPRSKYGPHASKYDLAKAVWEYISYLADKKVPLEELYVTNLCNEFLPHVHGSGTVLIPDYHARLGMETIQQVIEGGKFKVILPMAVQPFYHLCRLGFIDEDSELVKSFVSSARPSPSKAEQGLYAQSGKAPFLKVCGRRFQHHGIPVVPILHIKQWDKTGPKSRMVKYTEPMRGARREVMAALVDVR